MGTIRTRGNCATATKSYTSGGGARYDPPYAVENHINPEAVAFPYFDLFLLPLPWKHSTVTIGSRSSPVLKILGFCLSFLANLAYFGQFYTTHSITREKLIIKCKIYGRIFTVDSKLLHSQK